MRSSEMVRNLWFLVCAGALGWSPDARGAVLRIPSAFPTVRAAAAVAVAGDTILVAPGVYDESTEPGYPGVDLRGGVVMISEGGPAETTVLGPGLWLGWDPPHIGCVVRGFTFGHGDDWNGPGVSNGGQGSEIGGCVFLGTAFQGEGFSSTRSLSVHDCKLDGYNLELASPDPEQTFSVQRTVIDGRFSDNTIVLGGSSQFVFRSNTIVAPRSAFTGNLSPTAHVEVVNNIFYSPPEYTEGFGCYPPGVFDIRYNCLWNLVPVPPCPIGPTNIFADPRFCDFAQGNYRLQLDSPCIDAGEGGVTIGAFPAGCSATGIQEQGAPLAPAGPLLHGFLNPLLPGRPFKLELPVTSWVRARILDSSGRVVAVLADGSMAAGTHTLQWNGRGESRGVPASGVYFLTVEALNRRETYRVLIVR